ncbi:hypothetical protein [Azospirillum argentinense]|uniref:Uncharacterized protein n=1 Tax=Azospirillum argentinense TaxID=2970906 RepID=A0A5B0KPS0_9PROT|nr:hypothetical protein [Azospirillum argentinense]KAA1054687.1 hypothetical protein FH063_005963 [Azospirillum argentinense]
MDTLNLTNDGTTVNGSATLTPDIIAPPFRNWSVDVGVLHLTKNTVEGVMLCLLVYRYQLKGVKRWVVHHRKGFHWVQLTRRQWEIQLNSTEWIVSQAIIGLKKSNLIVAKAMKLYDGTTSLFMRLTDETVQAIVTDNPNHELGSIRYAQASELEDTALKTCPTLGQISKGKGKALRDLEDRLHLYPPRYAAHAVFTALRHWHQHSTCDGGPTVSPTPTWESLPAVASNVIECEFKNKAVTKRDVLAGGLWDG